MDDFQKILYTSGASLFAGLIGSSIAAVLAIRSTRKNKWWEFKQRAYSDIIEALFASLNYYNICLAHEESKTSGCNYQEAEREAKREELRKQAEQMLVNIEKARTLGAYLISKKANAILETLASRKLLTWQEASPYDCIYADVIAHKKAITDFADAAKKNLSVT